MPSLAAAILLVVPLVWPARFVGADADCFATSDPPVAPLPPAPPSDLAEAPLPPPPPEAPAPPARTPVAVTLWDEVVLVTVPVVAPEAG